MKPQARDQYMTTLATYPAGAIVRFGPLAGPLLLLTLQKHTLLEVSSKDGMHHESNDTVAAPRTSEARPGAYDGVFTIPW